MIRDRCVRRHVGGQLGRLELLEVPPPTPGPPLGRAPTSARGAPPPGRGQATAAHAGAGACAPAEAPSGSPEATAGPGTPEPPALRRGPSTCASGPRHRTGTPARWRTPPTGARRGRDRSASGGTRRSPRRGRYRLPARAHRLRARPGGGGRALGAGASRTLGPNRTPSRGRSLARRSRSRSRRSLARRRCPGSRPLWCGRNLARRTALHQPPLRCRDRLLRWRSSGPALFRRHFGGPARRRRPGRLTIRRGLRRSRLRRGRPGLLRGRLPSQALAVRLSPDAVCLRVLDARGVALHTDPE